MRGWGGLLVVAAAVLGSGANAAAAVQQDQLPAEVRAGDRHVVVKSGVVGDSGDRCGLFIAGVRAGSCDAGFPLRGMLEVELEHPAGQQTLTCRNCWIAKATEKKAPPRNEKKDEPDIKAPEPQPVPPGPQPVPPGPPVPPEPPVPPDPLPVMPDLTGFLLAEAVEQLTALGWTGQPVVELVPVEDVTKIDRVVGQTPAAGAQLGYADPVMVSIGEEQTDCRLSAPTHTAAFGAGLGDLVCWPAAVGRRQPEVVLGTVTVLPAAIAVPATTPTTTTTTTSSVVARADPPATRSAIEWVTPGVLGLLLLVTVGLWLILRTRRAATGRLVVAPPPGGVPLDPDGGDIRPVRVFLALASSPDEPWPMDQPLTPDTPYVLAVDIGELTAAGRGTVPLAVVAFDSRTPTLTGDRVRQVRLTGAAPDRVDFPLRTPAGPDRLKWRCGLYCRGVLVQSFVVLADVGTSGGWDADRDYVTSFGLDPAALDATEPHALSVMINHDTRDQHGVYTYFDSEQVAMTGYVPAGHIGKLRCDAERLYSMAGTGRMDRSALARTLGSFALHGLGVLSAITPDIDWAMLERCQDPEALWQGLAGEVRVQVAWPRGHSCPLPANIIYDYPLAEIDSSRLGLCQRFFDDLARHERPVCLAGRCVSASDTVVCPAGFWGYRLLLSCQPSQAATPVPDRDPASVPAAPSVVLGVSTDPRFLRRDQHLAELRQGLPEVVWHEERAHAALLDRLRDSQPNLVYLYCHGAVDPTQGIGYLELGPDDRLSARGMHGKVTRGAWQSRPLVLLNGCSTAALGDQTPNALIPKLLWAGASGVVGTDVDITEDWACAFADTAVPLLIGQGRAIGEAVRAGRLALLAAGSALGLTYVAFAPSDLRVIRS